MSEIKAGIVLKSRFQFAHSKEFASYIDYINRDEAIRNENYKSYSLYNDYMENPEKSGALFTEELDRLDDKQKRRLKKAFTLAQKNKSLMWQNVISFDNRYLTEHGAYNSKTQQLDEKKIQQLTRAAMTELLNRNGMRESALWSASIHYNTDNIHVHIAVVEPIPTRKRGKLLPKSLERAKSEIASVLLDRSPQQERIQQLVREQILAGKRSHKAFADRDLKIKFFRLHQKLPADRRQWFYNYNSIAHLRPEIDWITREYINRYHKADFEELKKRLKNEERVYKQTYGGDEYNRYTKNKIKDLYERMGNTILKELREYDKSLYSKQDRYMQQGYSPSAIRALSAAQFNIKKVEKAIGDNVQKYKNEIEYERLQLEIEYNR